MKMRWTFGAGIPADALRAVSRAVLLSAVALGLALLPAFAHASPPDPLWLGGVWDADDFDDVVVLACSVVKAVEAPAVSHDWLAPVPIALVAPALEAAPAAPLRTSLRSRAPPVA